MIGMLSLKKWLTRDWVQVLVTFFIVNLVRLFPLFFLNKTLYFGDNYSLLVPGKLFTVEWLRQGVIPLWNPYLFSGISWIGDISHALVYPTTLFFLILPPAQALNLTVLAHLLLTMVGMYLLARWFSKDHRASLLVSVFWMVSSQVTGSLNNLQTLQSLAWLPLVLFAALHVHKSLKGSLSFALVIAANLIAGYPQHVVSVLPVAALFSLVALRQESGWNVRSIGTWVRQWFMAGLVGMALSAFVLWPFVETLASSTRLAQSADQAAVGSLHPAELIKIWLPYFFDAPAWGLRWGPSWNTFPTAVPYITIFGWLTLVLCLKPKRLSVNQVFLVGLAAITLLVSLGKFIPGYTWVLAHVPFSSTMRYPSSWLVFTNIAWLLLVATVLPKFELSKKWYTWLFRLSIIASILAAIGWLVLRYDFTLVWNTLNQLTHQRLATSPFHTPERDQLIFSLITGNLVINLGLLTAALWLLFRRRWWWLIAVLMLDVSLNSQLIWMFAPNRVYNQPQNQALIQLVKDPQSRILTRNFNRPYTDFGSYWEALAVRWPFSDSFIDYQELQTAAHLQRLRDGLTPDWNEVAGVPIVNGYTTLLPLDYQEKWEGNAEARINALSYVAVDHPQLRNWSVKYYIVDEWFKIDEDFSAYKKVYSQYPWTVYELDALPRFRLANDAPVNLTEILENPNMVMVRFTNDTQEGYLKIADRYERGWSAWVNQQPVRVENWDGMRAVPIAAGQNEVVLKYQPLSFYAGSIISGLTTLSLALIGGVRGIRSRRKQATDAQAVKHVQEKPPTHPMKKTATRSRSGKRSQRLLK